MTNKYLYVQFCYIFLCTLIFIMPIVRLDGWNNLQFKHTHSSRFSGGWIRRDKFIWRNPATKDVSKRVLKCRSQNSGGSPSSVLGMIQGSLHWYIRDRLDPWCQGKAGGGGLPLWAWFPQVGYTRWGRESYGPSQNLISSIICGSHSGGT